MLSNPKFKSYFLTVPLSTQSGHSLCQSKQPVIDMDVFAKKGYRKIILPHSSTEDDSVNTADAFLINEENKWYFIEFKEARLGNAKASVLKKAYSNVYAVLDVLYAMKGTKDEYRNFAYQNPIEFIKNNVSYILVFSEADNPREVIQLKNHRQKGENYLPKFMERLPGYIYKEAYAMTETVFEYTFLKKFCY